jgi:hypothetical protein
MLAQQELMVIGGRFGAQQQAEAEKTASRTFVEHGTFPIESSALRDRRYAKGTFAPDCNAMCECSLLPVVAFGFISLDRWSTGAIFAVMVEGQPKEELRFLMASICARGLSLSSTRGLCARKFVRIDCGLALG